MLAPTLKRALFQIPARQSLRSLATSSILPVNDAPRIFKEDDIIALTLTVPKKDDHGPLQPSVSSLQPVYVQLSSLIRQETTGVSPRVAALSPSVFRHPIRRDILHLCVVQHLDGLRQGTAANKSRGEVKGSGRKIRAQKGTGQARLSDAQSPMLRGGGRAFAKKARDFSTKLPRKVIEMGMRVALSAKVKEQGLGIVENLQWPGAKTNDFAKRLRELGWNKTLFVTGLEEVPDTLDRSTRNLRWVDTITASELNVYEAVKWERLVLDVPAVKFFEKTLGRHWKSHMS